jgi:hypothetical protein
VPNASWFFPAIAKLREVNQNTDSLRLQDFVEVEVLSDPNGWAERWAELFARVLDEYPGVGTTFRKLRPRFLFDAFRGQQLKIEGGIVRVSTEVDLASRVLGHRSFARWLVLDCLARLLLLRSSATMAIWEQAFEERAITNEVSAEDEAAYFFVLAASGPDEDIDALQQAFGTEFERRWRWLRELITPYVM